MAYRRFRRRVGLSMSDFLIAANDPSVQRIVKRRLEPIGIPVMDDNSTGAAYEKAAAKRQIQDVELRRRIYQASIRRGKRPEGD